MLSASITSPITISSSGSVTLVSLTPSVDEGSSIELTSHGTFSNVATWQATFGNGSDVVNYDNTGVDGSGLFEMRGYANAYEDGSWGVTLFVVFHLNEVVIKTFQGDITSMPLEFVFNPTFGGGGGSITVLDATIKQIA